MFSPAAPSISGPYGSSVRVDPRRSGILVNWEVVLVAQLEPGLKYVDGEIDGVVIRALRYFHDQRGWLIETFRHDELEKDHWPTMMYVSSTLPGVAPWPPRAC